MSSCQLSAFSPQLLAFGYWLLAVVPPAHQLTSSQRLCVTTNFAGMTTKRISTAEAQRRREQPKTASTLFSPLGLTLNLFFSASLCLCGEQFLLSN